MTFKIMNHDSSGLKEKEFTSFQMKSVAFEDGADMWLALGTAES